MDLKEYFEICNEVRSRVYGLLREAVRGYVTIWCDNDVLNVRILKDEFDFKYEINNISIIYSDDDAICTAVSELLHVYRISIMKKYIK